jgi:hypothetical protein
MDTEPPALEGFELFLNDLDDLYEAIELLKRSEYFKEYLTLGSHLHQVQLSLESITLENNRKEETDDN